MLTPQLRRIYQLPPLTTPKTELTGAYLVWDVPLGPVVGAYKSMRGTPEQLAEYLGQLSAYNALPSTRKSVEYRTIAEKTASPNSQPNSSTMEELDPLSMCLGCEIFVDVDPDGVYEYKVVYDGTSQMLVWVDGDFARSTRGKIPAKIVPNPGGSSLPTIDLLDLTPAQMDEVMALAYTDCDADPAASPAWSYPGHQFDALDSQGRNCHFYCTRGTYDPNAPSTTGVGPAWHYTLKKG